MSSKYKIPQGKKQLHVLIDENLYKLLIEIAPGVYGKGRGGISYVVEEALRQYLFQYTHKKHTNPHRSVRLIYDQVVEEVKSILHYNFKPSEIPEKILDQAISSVRGADPRTISKWKNLFEKSGLIKIAGGFPPNRIVELM